MKKGNSTLPKHIIAVGGLVSDENGKIILAQHPDRGWEIPGGQVNVGEDLHAALQREIKEETGVDISIGQLVGIYQNIQAESVEIPTKIIFDFLACKKGGKLLKSKEHLEVKWCSRIEILDMITNPIYYDRVKQSLNFTGKILFRAYSKNPYKLHKEFFLQ